MKTDELANQIIERASGAQRYIVAIAGPPASGKSTLAETLCEMIQDKLGRQSCSVVPMDGFHLDNRILEERGLMARKGSLDTFDALGFLHLIERISRESTIVYAPVFDRRLDLAIAGAQMISPHNRIVLVEGNYLLCDVPIWRELKAIFDFSIHLKVPQTILEERLIRRWLDHGYDQAGAEKKARSNDIPNAQFVSDNTMASDLTIETKV